ncbi:uroporphyrinogen decarboxylase family protein [Candidatus Formimonas warabiya]|uniref:Uroporphyrinogen decarboxylase (URO-D) domain-containing protein n=1 Tax=Formimonas warabiya TaxID=1761012 RepID=A0A3G1KYC4_FORW1|nr:uroporphyrinogen decarboxylase family protein [Candidatus Formimonas warabiya]ATW27452.1 hypothetical protein DCMF_24285 [Candidatus Formimonas warabiya]
MAGKLNRMALLRRGKTPDRVPVLVTFDWYSGKMMGSDPGSFFLNPKLALEACIWTNKLFPVDSGYSYYLPNGTCWDFGGELEFGAHIWPTVRKRPVTTMADVDKLQVPDPQSAPAFALTMEFSQLCWDLGEGAGIYLSSPLERVAQLTGVETLLRWLYKAPEPVHYLMRLMVEYSMKEVTLYLDRFGRENLHVGYGYPVESHQLISPKRFEELCAPYIKELHERIGALGITSCSEHLCGDHTHNLWFWKEELKLPKHTYISLDGNTDIFKASNYLGEHFVLGGNLKNSILSCGSPQEVYYSAKELVQRLKHRAGGYVLAPDCGLPATTPPVNVVALIQAAEDFGYYDAQDMLKDGAVF